MRKDKSNGKTKMCESNKVKGNFELYKKHASYPINNSSGQTQKLGGSNKMKRTLPNYDLTIEPQALWQSSKGWDHPSHDLSNCKTLADQMDYNKFCKIHNNYVHRTED